MKTRLITTIDIESIIALKSVDAFMDELIDCLRIGFLSLDAANSNIPVRTGLSYKNPDIGLLEWMPAMVDQGKASLKIVGYHPSNPERFHLPTILSTLCIFDTDTGHLAGILDGTFATAARTGAMSAIATQQLCPKINDGIIGVIGCGAQAVTQLHALSRSMTIRKVVAYDTDESAAQSLQSRVPFLDAEIICLMKKEELPYLLENSDVICTCTSESPGLGPVFADGDHKGHLHINAVGSDFPGKIEVPKSLLLRSMVVPDFAQQALKEGECQQLTQNEIKCDLCGLLNSPELQIEGKQRLSVFDSTGHAFADYLTGLFLMAQAERYNIGTPVQIECAPPDPKDPYSFLQKSTLQEANGPMESALKK